MMDKDGSDTLSRDELVEGYRMIYGDNYDEEEIDALINMADVNDDGVISYSEWLMISMNRNKILTHEKLEAAFNGFDIDHSNTVSFEEIKNFLFGSKAFDHDFLKSIIKKYEPGSDGEMSLDHFKKLMFDLLS